MTQHYVTEYITVEPAPDLAGPFAVWCLGRDANVQTVSAGGFLVPLDWYADVPSELLSGAVVDGFAYDRSMPQPEAVKQPVAPSVAETDGPRDTTNEPPKARKRAAKKTTPDAYTRKPSDAAVDAALSTASSEASE